MRDLRLIDVVKPRRATAHLPLERLDQLEILDLGLKQISLARCAPLCACARWHGSWYATRNGPAPGSAVARPANPALLKKLTTSMTLAENRRAAGFFRLAFEQERIIMQT